MVAGATPAASFGIRALQAATRPASGRAAATTIANAATAAAAAVCVPLAPRTASTTATAPATANGTSAASTAGPGVAPRAIAIPTFAPTTTPHQKSCPPGAVPNIVPTTPPAAARHGTAHSEIARQAVAGSRVRRWFSAHASESITMATRTSPMAATRPPPGGRKPRTAAARVIQAAPSQTTNTPRWPVVVRRSFDSCATSSSMSSTTGVMPGSWALSRR
ncbi:hypothetical protein [Fodinicola feengrottensis]|uniref:hypothetical protein n=1 Tax=Fodinicola feengrottensis TaxID=435914 RepID=UPI0013D8B7D7|nr:hypothetical protein [Fodinicola feengrottensis]